jgi:hypothetical protein
MVILYFGDQSFAIKSHILHIFLLQDSVAVLMYITVNTIAEKAKRPLLHLYYALDIL